VSSYRPRDIRESIEVVLVTSSPSDPHSKTGIRKVICGSPGAVFKPITTPGQGYSAFPRRSSSGNMRRSWGWSETDNAYATSPKPRHWDEKHEEVKPAFIRKSGRELDREVLRIAPKARNQSRPVLDQSRPVLDQSRPVLDQASTRCFHRGRNRDRDETVQHSQSELVGKNIPEKSKAQRQWFRELLE
jgi:hypothetical protein